MPRKRNKIYCSLCGFLLPHNLNPLKSRVFIAIEEPDNNNNTPFKIKSVLAHRKCKRRFLAGEAWIELQPDHHKMKLKMQLAAGIDNRPRKPSFNFAKETTFGTTPQIRIIDDLEIAHNVTGTIEIGEMVYSKGSNGFFNKISTEATNGTNFNKVINTNQTA